jgi:hypothetical protein
MSDRRLPAGALSDATASAQTAQESLIFAMTVQRDQQFPPFGKDGGQYVEIGTLPQDSGLRGTQKLIFASRLVRESAFEIASSSVILPCLKSS